MYKKLFTREIKIDTYNKKQYYLELVSKLNFKNIDNYSNKSIYDLWNINYEDIFLAYRFKVLKDWIFHNEKYSSTFIKNLNYIIKILDVEKYLNAFETNYIEHYESIIFCKSRNIKKLIVDFNTNLGEEVWFKFSCSQFIQFNEKKEPLFLNSKTIDIFLSNQRLIISTPVEIQSINWKDIIIFKLQNNKIEIVTKFSKFYIISIEIYEIYVSVERICKIINIKL